MMEGLDKEWNYTHNNQSISYAKLPPGKYIFRVKGSNNDELWNEEGASVEIEVLPPWWQSRLAMICYFILFILLLYSFLKLYMKRTEKRQEEKQKLFESEKEKELYSSRVEFFTNIAHEIRTPVTLINGPLEAMLEMEIKDPEIIRNLNTMSKSTSELLGLVNQLLDFRKIDSNKFLLNFSTYNISGFLREMHSRFEPIAYQQNKSMTLLLPAEDTLFQYDREALTKILNNLYTNALRYSEHYIEVELLIETNWVYIKMRNDGDLIDDELSEKIFDSFFQGNKHRNNPSSSGIGLSLARSLTELHNGKLYYNEFQQLNEFVVGLPLKQEDVKEEPEEIPEENYIINESEFSNEKQNAEIILLVEDNVEMLTFIANRLQKQFGVEKAVNGIEALNILKEKKY